MHVDDIHQNADNLSQLIRASTTHAQHCPGLKREHDEVPVSSTEVLEANVVVIRDNLNELKSDFRAAVARIDNDVKTAVIRLQDEIRAMAAKAESNLEKTSARIEKQLAEMRQDTREMRAKDKERRQ